MDSYKHVAHFAGNVINVFGSLPLTCKSVVINYFEYFAGNLKSQQLSRDLTRGNSKWAYKTDIANLSNNFVFSLDGILS